MKTIPRRLLALLLALAMAMSLLSVSVWAAEAQDEPVPLAVQEEDDDDEEDGDASVDDSDESDDDPVTDMTETVDGFVWSLSGGTLTISGSGTVANKPEWMDSAVFSKLVLSNGITGIGEDLFSGYSTLAEVSLPGSLTAIGEAAFANCPALKSIDLPSGVSSIADSTFSDCSGLTSVTIPASVTTIGDYAFLDCTSLQFVTLEKTVTEIGEDAFHQTGPGEDDDTVPLKDFYIQGYSDSYAEQYAKDNSIPFVPLDKEVKVTKAALKKKKVTYTGMAQQPVVTVLDGDGNVVPAEFYKVTLSQKKPTNAGKYTLTVTAAKKPYTGSVKATFTIQKAGNPIQVKVNKAKIKVKAKNLKQKPYQCSNLTISNKKGIVTCKLKNALKNKTKAVDGFKIGNNGKLTVPKGLGPGKYTVVIVVTADPTKNYFGKTVTVNFDVVVS